ncbi:selenide, water dikinase SelD [Streptomyces chartreusis]|uniref:selenide, water dikinase SelD n=1 Tax=Streptomyces chartreusis TaxID=1969 RepID=UPI0033EB298B
MSERPSLCHPVPARSQAVRVRDRVGAGRVVTEARPIDLLGLSPAAGCGCKVPLQRLSGFMTAVDEMVGTLNATRRVHTDGRSRDDAALYEIAPDQLLAVTVDFGTPVSSDAATWGRVAALNALSDIFAMGATPILALSVLGWPDDIGKAPMLALTRAAVEALSQASAVLLGGHTIISPTPLFGLAVVGTAKPGDVMLIRNAQPGNLLILTKPLGTGIVLAAVKAGVVGPEAASAAEAVMTSSNQMSAELAISAGVRAATDVTGYGLVGHLHNMLSASGCAAEIDAKRVPALPSADRLLEEHGVVPNSAERTYFELEGEIDWGRTPLSARFLLSDPQTSGGLLLAAAPDVAERFLTACAKERQFAAVIGSVTTGQPGAVLVRA